MALLFDSLQQQRCLLILDNLESILEKGTAGTYHPGYEDYRQLIQGVGQRHHQSCLLLTSREMPRGFGRLQADYPEVQSLPLAGLSTIAGTEVLKARGLKGAEAQLATLVQRYSGNPLALKLAAEAAREVYAGDIEAFLREEVLIFDDISDILDQQFRRLSALERALLVWLAIEREPVTPHQLWDNLVRQPTRRAFLEALRSLKRRSLLQQASPPTTGESCATSQFMLANVVMEYITDNLIATIGQALESEQLDGLQPYTLLKAQSQDEVRQSQRRLFLQPVATQLVDHLGEAGAVQLLHRLLTSLQAQPLASQGYAGTNLIHLFVQLGADLQGYDLSNLRLRQADLRNAALTEVNLTRTDLQGAVFAEPFTLIHAVAFSPDGTRLAASTSTGDIRLWNLTDAQPLAIYHASPTFVWSIAFSPDSNTLACGSNDGTLRLWELSTGRLRHTIDGHDARVRSVAFSSDGQSLASGSSDHTVGVWDTRSGQLRQRLHGHTGTVLSVAFSLDGWTLASGSADGTIRLWHIGATGRFRPGQRLEAHASSVESIAWSPDSRILISGSSDTTIRLWHIHDGQLLQTLSPCDGPVFCVAFSPDGQQFASSTYRSIHLWDYHGIEFGQPRQTLRGQYGEIWSVAFGPTGRHLASGGLDATVRLWDPHTGHLRRTLQGYDNSVWSVALHPDGRTLASSGYHSAIGLWDLSTGTCRRSLVGHTGMVYTLAFSPCGEMLASGSIDGTIRLWDVHQGQLHHLWRPHTGFVTSIVFSPDGRTLASCGRDHQVCVQDVDTGDSRWTLHGHTDYVWHLAFSPDGGTLASSSSDQTTRLWNVDTGKPLHILRSLEDTMAASAFHPAGHILAGASGSSIYLWHAASGRPLHTLSGEHSELVQTLVWSADGELLASASYDHTICLWQVRGLEPPKLYHTLRGHAGPVMSIVCAADRRTLISGSTDATIRVWDMWTGTCLQTLHVQGPYADMDMTGTTGLTLAQQTALKALGAVGEPAITALR